MVSLAAYRFSFIETAGILAYLDVVDRLVVSCCGCVFDSWLAGWLGVWFIDRLVVSCCGCVCDSWLVGWLGVWFIEREKYFRKICREIHHSAHFMFNNFFPKIVPFMR
jgi:hypothetical protein